MSGANLDHAVGRTLGERYELVSRIGSGASAEVYLATDLRLGRRVAVKQLRSSLTDDARFAKLFRSEAQLAANLSHPNILTVFDWSADDDSADGGAYIVTELLGGGTLRTLLDTEGTISLAQAAYIGLQTAQGLVVAHSQGLVHRDIKPANLLFGHDGRVRIADFGIARAVAEAAWTEPEGVLIGTARYAAPEQATVGAIDGLVDVYSLAICLIEALTGEVPLVRDNALGTMMLRQEVDLPVDGSFGVLAEPLAWAGMADTAERATAVELRDALLLVCRTLPDPDPLTLVDLTETGVGRVQEEPNVWINDDGEVIIDGGDDADLALGDPHQDGGPHQDSGPHQYSGPDQYGSERSGSRVRRWVIGLLLLATAGAAAVIAGRLLAESQRPDVSTIPLGIPSYAVADFEGMTPDEVEAAVESNRWSVVVTEEFVDGTEAGQLLSQDPEPGSQMGPGGQVDLVYSLGPQRRVIPEMIGRSEADVRSAIEAAMLTVGSVVEAPNEDVEAGVVLEATIEGVPAQPGAEFLTGTTIDLLVSSGPAPREVPPLAGLTLEQARLAVQDQDLVLATAEAYSEAVGEGLVIGVDPGPGSLVARGDTVTATVSLGRPFVIVPDLTGRPVSEAIDELRAAGFGVVINGSVGAEVLTTRPTAGTSVRSGTEIEIISAN